MLFLLSVSNLFPLLSFHFLFLFFNYSCTWVHHVFLGTLSSVWYGRLAAFVDHSLSALDLLCLLAHIFRHLVLVQSARIVVLTALDF